MWYKSNTRFVVFLLLCLFALGAQADTHADTTAESKDEREVAYLIDFVANSGAVFVRNGSEHNAQEAADHLAMKYNRAGRYAKTAEDFIDNLASKSSITRKPYMIILSDGSEIPSRDWLYGALNDYRQQQATPSSTSSAGH